MTSLRVRHLNFLEQKEHASKAAFTLNYFWIVVIVVSFATIASSYSLYQKNRIKKIQAQIDSINTEIGSLKEAQQKEQQKQQSAAALKEVLSGPVMWSDLLKQIAKKIPEPIKLVHISGSITDKRTLTIKGNSSFMLPVFRLKDGLSTMKTCEKPRLVSVEQTVKASDEEPLTFQMECTLL